MEDGYFRHGWYQTAWSDDIAKGEMISRKLFGASIIMARDDDGKAFALADSCPHRFVPLSRGKFDGSRVACAYHGLEFDRTGQCVHNPQGQIAARAAVRAYPLCERSGRIWLWFGKPDAADEALIPPLPEIDDVPDRARGHITMQMPCSWRLLVDNLLDLSHADFLHPAFGKALSSAEMTVRDRGDGVVVRWSAGDVETPPIHRALVSDDRADLFTQADWHAPATILITGGASSVGKEAERLLFTLHNVTPESPTTCYYFIEFSRNFDYDNDHLTQMLTAIAAQAFEEEDKPVLEAQQANLGQTDPFALEPLVLAGDRAAVLVRRKMAKFANELA